jgi:hypothetical protein
MHNSALFPFSGARLVEAALHFFRELPVLPARLHLVGLSRARPAALSSSARRTARRRTMPAAAAAAAAGGG